LTSVDPQPRASIDPLCDCVIRQPLEEVDTGLFEELQPGDFLFIDSSHRAFTNSDVTILFMNLLPSLGNGVVVHLHDHSTILPNGMTATIPSSTCWALFS
jgi:hypothetical protein